MAKAKYRLRKVAVTRAENQLVVFGNVERNIGDGWKIFRHLERKVALSDSVIETIQADLEELARKDFINRYQPENVVDLLEEIEIEIDDTEDANS